MREVLIALALVPRGGNYENMWARIRVLGLDAEHLRSSGRAQGLRSCGNEELIDAAKSSRSYAEVFRKLGIKQGGGTQAALTKRVEQLGLDLSHFLGQAWRRGSTVPVIPARPIEEPLVTGRFIRTHHLKTRLIAEGLKDAKCEVCGLDQWNGESIPLELDHITGRREDNRLKNLRLLCPNCHAQTDTYRGRNIGAARLS